MQNLALSQALKLSQTRMLAPPRFKIIGDESLDLIKKIKIKKAKISVIGLGYAPENYYHPTPIETIKGMPKLIRRSKWHMLICLANKVV